MSPQEVTQTHNKHPGNRLSPYSYGELCHPIEVDKKELKYDTNTDRGNESQGQAQKTQ